MPYSTEERNELDFYKSLVSELRNKHINEIKDSIESKPRFRDSEGVLQSFDEYFCLISTFFIVPWFWLGLRSASS